MTKLKMTGVKQPPVLMNNSENRREEPLIRRLTNPSYSNHWKINCTIPGDCWDPRKGAADSRSSALFPSFRARQCWGNSTRVSILNVKCRISALKRSHNSLFRAALRWLSPKQYLKEPTRIQCDLHWFYNEQKEMRQQIECLLVICASQMEKERFEVIMCGSDRCIIQWF